MGLTAEYCVKFTALDAKTLDYEVYLIEDAVAFIDPDLNHIKNYLENMKLSNIKTILSKEI